MGKVDLQVSTKWVLVSSFVQPSTRNESTRTQQLYENQGFFFLGGAGGERKKKKEKTTKSFSEFSQTTKIQTTGYSFHPQNFKSFIFTTEVRKYLELRNLESIIIRISIKKTFMLILNSDTNSVLKDG